jgi:hypothetical protein
MSLKSSDPLTYLSVIHILTYARIRQTGEDDWGGSYVGGSKSKVPYVLFK